MCLSQCFGNLCHTKAIIRRTSNWRYCFKAGMLRNLLHEFKRLDSLAWCQTTCEIFCRTISFTRGWNIWNLKLDLLSFFFRLVDPGRTNGHLEIELVGLRKNPYRRQNFCCPENHETIKVSKKNIVKILPNPTMNRRGEFVFEDKSILDYTFD